MRNNVDYYGNENNDAVTYLEFGAVDLANKKKTIWAYWQDQEAYDLYMFGRYARDLFAFRKFLNENTVHTIEELKACIKNSAHDKVLDYIFKYAALLTGIRYEGVQCESGSSLYGWIEEAMACDTVFHDGKNLEDILHTDYLASDISEIMNEGAVVLHPNTNILSSTAPTLNLLMDDIEKRNIRFSLFYGLSVSIRYAARGAADFARMTGLCNLQAYNRLSLSFGETSSYVYGSGKTVYVIGLDELREKLQACGVVAKYCTANMQWNKDGDNTVRASIVIGKDEEMVEAFIKEYERCIDMVSQSVAIEKGEWRDLEELKK